MSKQYRILRKVKSIALVASGADGCDLPRDYDYEAIFLRISASIVVSADATSVRAEAPTQLVSRIQVISDGKNVIYNAPFWFACLGCYQRSLPESGARAVTPPSAATAATYAVEAIGVIDLMNVDGRRPKDSNFRSSQLSLLQLQMQFGAALSPFVPGTGAATLGATSVVDVFVQQLVELPDDKTGKYSSPIALKKVSFTDVAVLATNANQEQRLPAGNMIRSVMIRAGGNVTAGEPSATMLNNVQLAAGVDVRMNLSAAQLRAKNNADYGQLTAGYYVADVASKGNADTSLSELWDVSGAAEPKAVVDVNGATNNTLTFVTTEFIPARG